MAVFGAPTALEDHAFRACLAALGVQEEAKRLAVDIQERDGVDLRMRVGRNSGQADAAGGPAVLAVGAAQKWRSERPRTRRRSPALCLHARDRTARQVSRRCRWPGRGGASRLDISVQAWRVAVQQPEQQRGPLPGCLWLFADVRACWLRWHDGSPANANERPC
jgi:hypothetical protein